MDTATVRGRLIIIIGIIVFSIFGLLLDSVGVVTKLYDLSSIVSLPVRFELRKISMNTNNFLGAISKISSLQHENESLFDENVDLKAQLSNFEEVNKELEMLKAQIQVLDKTEDPALEARVIGADIALGNTLQINVGTRDNVEESDIVVFGDYAVGRIIRVETYSSLVMLITSPSSNISARGQKNRAKGLVNGNVGLVLTMSEILLDEEIVNGEIIITSGLDSEYPAGLILGIASTIRNNPAFATKEAEVEVQLDFSELDYVYVIKGQK